MQNFREITYPIFRHSLDNPDTKQRREPDQYLVPGTSLRISN